MKILNDYVSRPAQNSVFIMLHDGSLKKETRDMFRALKPISLDLKESEIPLWVKQRVKSKGLEISDEAIDYLMGLIGPDVGFLSSEIEKISLLGTGRINIDDIADIIAGGRSYSIFDLVDALEKKDAERAFKIYKTLRETADDYSLIGALNWQYARTLVAGGRQTRNEYLYRLFEILHMTDRDIKSSGRAYPMEYLFIRLLRLREGSPGKKGRLPSW
jgi:DNA polymerase-3 subunit delta